MPVLHSTIPSVYQTVTRPAIMGVLDRLMLLTGIRHARIVLPNGEMVTPPSATTIDEKEIYSEFGNRTKIFVETTEEIMRESLQTTAQYENETVRFYNDPGLKCFFAPIIQKMKVTLSLRYRNKHRNAVASWVNTMANKIKNDSLMIDSTIDFTYILPNTIVELLCEIYNRSEAIAGHGDTLPEYIRKHFTTNFTILENMNGMHKTPAIRYIQPLARGIFDIDAEPQKVKGEVGGTWEASVQYVFYYDKPVSVFSRYSPMIHSQLLSQKFLIPYFTQSYRNWKTINYKSIHHLNKATGVDTKRLGSEAVEGYSEQNYDDWLPNYRQKMLHFDYRTLIVVDDDGLVLDMNALGSYRLTEEAKRYLRVFNEEATEFRKALIFLVLYEDGDQLEAKYLHLDKDLKLYYTGPVNKRKVYRLVVSSLIDPRDLFRDAWEQHENLGDIIGWDPAQEQIIGGVWSNLKFEVIAWNEALYQPPEDTQ